MEKTKNILGKLNNWKFFILLIVVIIGSFYWVSARPVLAKRSCYKKATEIAIKKQRDDDSAPYLYDRNNWKNYKTFSNNSNLNSNSSSSSGFFDFSRLNAGTWNPTFEENLKSGTEPSYIQENLDKIAKETTFNQEDYEDYYKLCLQSKGL